MDAAARVSAPDPLDIEVGWPAQELSPNARVHHMVHHRFKKAAKQEAQWATRIAMPARWRPAGERVNVHLICHLPKGGKTPDADNLIASCKAVLDGISDIIGINDREFEAPTIEWADRTERGKLVVRLS